MFRLLALLVPFIQLVLLEAGSTEHHLQKRYKYIPHPYPYYQPNASAVYDPTTESCCKGKVQPKTRMEQCCGNGVYKPSREFCCDGTVLDLKVGFECCGNETYDTETQICCNKQVIDLVDPNNPNLGCCDTEVYDMSKQKCCILNSDTIAVLDTPNPNKMSCCGIKLYDPETQTCCEDLSEETAAVYTKSEEGIKAHICCGTQLGDANTNGCCGNTTYNLNNEACCYTVQGMTIAKLSKPGDSCCGSSGGSYDPQTQLCCEDEIFDKTDSNMACCGNKTINTTEEICCWSINGSNTIKKDAPDHNGCCEDKSYNMYKQVCCTKDSESVVYTNDEEGKSYGCCGLHKFEYTNQICCGEEISKQEPDYSIQCCGNETYNTKKQTCCYEYDPIQGMTNTTLINEVKVNSICCGGELYTTSSNKGCCNNKVFDTLTEVCCGSKIISKEGNESRDKCCYENDELTSPYPYYK